MKAIAAAVIIAGSLLWEHASAASRVAARSEQAGDTAVVTVTRNGIVVQFPSVDFTKVGCGFFDSGDTAATWSYQWWVVMKYADHAYPHNHMTGLYLDASIPKVDRDDEAKVEKALTAGAIVVTERRGEPPFPVWEQSPAKSSISVKDDRLVVEIMDSALVSKFLAPAKSEVDVGWCDGRSLKNIAGVALNHG